jgi:hypothetical protein
MDHTQDLSTVPDRTYTVRKVKSSSGPSYPIYVLEAYREGAWPVWFAVSFLTIGVGNRPIASVVVDGANLAAFFAFGDIFEALSDTGDFTPAVFKGLLSDLEVQRVDESNRLGIYESETTVTYLLPAGLYDELHELAAVSEMVAMKRKLAEAKVEGLYRIEGRKSVTLGKASKMLSDFLGLLRRTDKTLDRINDAAWVVDAELAQQHIMMVEAL